MKDDYFYETYIKNGEESIKEIHYTLFDRIVYMKNNGFHWYKQINKFITILVIPTTRDVYLDIIHKKILEENRRKKRIQERLCKKKLNN